MKDASPENSANLDKEIQRLKWLHLAAAIFMGIQTIAMPFVGLKTTVPLVTGFPDDAVRDGPVGVPALQKVDNFYILVLLNLFIGLAALDHIIVSLIAFLAPDTFYEYLGRRNTNPIRWLEYFFSASIMAILIALLTGIYDIHHFFLIGAMTAACMVTGLMIEFIPKTNEDKDVAFIYRTTAWGLFLLGSFSCFVPWLNILCFFFQDTSGIPDFVYAAFLITLLLFALFGLNMLLYYFFDMYSFQRAEMYYIILSFTAKTVLAWDVFGGFKASEDE